MLPRNALLGAVAVGVAAFYCKLWGVQFFHPQETLLTQLQQESNRRAGEPVIVFLGRAFFWITAAAWVVLSMQSVVVGIQRACYKPKVRKPLRPLTEEELRQQQQQDQEAAAATSAASKAQPKPTTPAADQDAAQTARPRAPAAAAAAAAARAPAPAAAAPSPPQSTNGQAAAKQQQQGNWRDERRMRALEAAQRALDEQAAALRVKQEQEEAERRARRAAAAAAAAELQAKQEAERQARLAEAAAAAADAAAEAEERRARWNQAVRDQWQGVPLPQAVGAHDPADASNDSGVTSSSTAAAAGSSGAHSSQGGVNPTTTAAAAATESPAGIMQQQDWEYQQSLEADRAKATERAAQHQAVSTAKQLADLRQSLQQRLPSEPAANCGLPILTLRVRLPGGAQASRRFTRNQGFVEVLDWVYSLKEMPLWAPGSWSLVSGFPRRQLAPPSSSVWAPGVWQQQQAAAAAAEADMHDGGEGDVDDGEGSPSAAQTWQLQVYRLACGMLRVEVQDCTTLKEVKHLVEVQTGIPSESQRLVYKGQVLDQLDSTLADLSISRNSGQMLHLAVSGRAVAAAAARADDDLYGESGSSAAAAAAAAEAPAPAAVSLSDPGSSSSSGSGGGASESAASAGERAQELAKAAEHAYLGSGDVLVVRTVAELQQRVAAGAPLLALYVEATDEQM